RPLKSSCATSGPMHRSKNQALFDHLVGTAQERDWNGKAECLGGLEVEEQLDFSGLLNRQVGRLIAFENPAGVDACCPECVRKTASIAHQAAGRGELTKLIDRGHCVPHRQRRELFEPASEQ